MHKGYHFSMASELLSHYESRVECYIDIGRAQKDAAKKVIKEKILSGKWVIDGDGTESEWFPQLKKHVFISHSHKDEAAALFLAGLLKDRLGIDAFVDSAAWGCYRELAERLYEAARGPYMSLSSSQKDLLRSSATEHAHCMLSKSLIQMMDRCECMFFLNTKASVGLNNIGTSDYSTFSPWIYTEIEASRVLRRYKYQRFFAKAANESLRSFARGETVRVQVSYPLNLEHLDKLSPKRFFQWVANAEEKKRHLADDQYRPYKLLDELYANTEKVSPAWLSSVGD